MRHKDYLKWLDSQNTRRARAAARATTSEGTTMEAPSVSVATTQKNQTSSYSIQAERAAEMAKFKQFLMEEYIQTFRHQYQELSNRSMELRFRNYSLPDVGGMLNENSSASPTETKTENLSVFKDVTTTPKGQLKPST